MSLSNFTGTVTAAALRANFDDATATLATNAVAGQKDQTIVMRVASLVAATALSLRSVAFTANDDYELRVIAGRGTADATSRTLTVTLEVSLASSDTAADDDYLIEHTISESVTSSSAATFDTRTAGDGDYRTTAGARVRLIKGVRYRLKLATDAGTWTDALAMLQLRTVRRAS